jgi:hypothetical protein
MDGELIYSMINLGVMPAWLMLALLPRWQGTRVIVHSLIYPFVYGVLYCGLLVSSMFFGPPSDGGGFSTLAGVMALFDRPVSVLAGWSHYLVFDLFVGAWIGRDALRRGVSHFLVVPSLFFCLMFGPVGLVIYLAARGLTGKGGFALDERAGVAS